ncbi:nitrite reductase (NAD(P)H) small subunit [Aeromonas rivipollensis]
MFLLLTRHYKQRYALMDGRCLDYPALSVACWPVRLDGGEVWVQLG